MSDIVLTAAWVASAMAGTIVAGSPAAAFAGVSIDSRTLGAGDLYVALHGERFDGVDFVPAAVRAGAGGVVVPAGRGQSASSGVVIEVDDPVAALQRLGHAVRHESAARVVAITGSAGKTTTKEVTAEFLAANYRVIRNRGNLNNHIGLPLSLIELRTRPEIAVVELGMNHAGEISTLVGIAEPDVRVWTNVAEAHLGFFDSLDAIADAKAEILEGADRSTLLVANADDDRVMTRVKSFPGRTLTFGIDRPADVSASRVVERGIHGTSATVATPRGTIELSTRLLGRGNLANVLASIAVATDFGISLDAIAARSRGLQAAAHRGQVVVLANGATVIDDSYNANPTAMRRALDVLAHSPQSSEPTPTRRVAVLGEMLELGAEAVAQHESVGRYAVSRTDVLVAVGGEAAKALGRAAVEDGLPAERVHYCDTSDAAADLLTSLVRTDDVVLVKGSRGIRTDLVVQRLKAGHA